MFGRRTVGYHVDQGFIQTLKRCIVCEQELDKLGWRLHEANIKNWFERPGTIPIYSTRYFSKKTHNAHMHRNLIWEVFLVFTLICHLQSLPLKYLLFHLYQFLFNASLFFGALIQVYRYGPIVINVQIAVIIGIRYFKNFSATWYCPSLVLKSLKMVMVWSSLEPQLNRRAMNARHPVSQH